MTSKSRKSGSVEDATGAGGGGRQESALDRRRRKFWRARSAADDAAGVVRQLEERIDTNAGRGRTYEANLRAALDEVAGLKKAIKTSAKEADGLRAERKAARERAAEAQQRAERAESKYDEVMLVELLRREKDKDLATYAPSRRERPGDEVSGSTTARTTAARRTATRARTTGGRRARTG